MKYEEIYSETYVKYSIKAFKANYHKILNDLDKYVIFVMMDGGYWFYNALTSDLQIPLETYFIKGSSYKGKEHACQIQWKYFTTMDLTGKDIIVVDDIVDSGDTLKQLHYMFNGWKINSLTFFSLIKRHNSPIDEKKYNLLYAINADTDEFLVGCGMDDNGVGRNLNYIGKIEK